MGTENRLKEGLFFGSYEEVDTFVKKWSAECFSPLIIRSSFRGHEKANGRLHYCCPHGVERQSRAKGDRPRQHVLFTNCPFVIHVNENRQTKRWTISKVNLKHQGHMLGPEVYGGYQNVRKMSAEDVKFMNELDAVGASRRRIAERMGEKTGNVYKAKDIQNAMVKLKRAIADGGVLEKYLADIQTDGGDVKWSKNLKGQVEVLWIQTRSMAQDVARTRPYVWQTDTTFSTNRQGYKLYIPLHKSVMTGRYQVSGLLFLATENRENVLTGLRMFKVALPYTSEEIGSRFHFLVDKDFDYIEVLYSVFSGCRVLLDGVHVMRYFREKVFPGARFEDGSQVDKEIILQCILQCRDSHTPEQYNQRRQDLMTVTDGLIVRPGRVKVPVSFKQYYDDNWERICPMWVLAYRKKMPLQGVGSTQAVESFFRVLKMYEKQIFGHRLPSLDEFIPAISKALDQQFGGRHILVENKRVQYFHKDPIMKQALDAASWELNPIGIKLFYENINLYELRLSNLEIVESGRIKGSH